MMTPRERVLAAAKASYEQQQRRGNFDADLDESTGLVTIYQDGTPAYIMHLDVFLELYDELAAKHGMPTSTESE